jgi:hypothetical protein
MCLLTLDAATARGIPVRFEDGELQALLLRVSAEFQEMPGLILTMAQAARLFSIHSACCERVLRLLVDRGVLSTDGHVFARADAGLRVA